MSESSEKAVNSRFAQEQKLEAMPDLGMDARSSSFLEDMVLRQEEYLSNLTRLHQDMLLKIETEWKSRLIARRGSHTPYDARRASNSYDARPIGSAFRSFTDGAMRGSTDVSDRADRRSRSIDKSPSAVSASSKDGKTAFDVTTCRDSRIKIVVEKNFTEERPNAVKEFVKSGRFDFVTASLVIANSFFIGIQVEHMYSTTKESSVIISVDVGFCVVFVAELLLRLYTYGCREYFLGTERAWNCFDLLIVTCFILDTAISLIIQSNVPVFTAARSLRVLRALRIFRVFRFFRDLRIMMAAIISTVKTAIWAFVLLLMAMYVFGIAIAQIVVEYKRQQEINDTPLDSNDALLKWFGSLPETFFTLFLAITGGIDYEISIAPLKKKLPLSLGIYVFFIIFSTLCVMNVMTGIFCQSAIQTFETDREQVIRLQLAEKERFVSTLSSMLQQWDASGTGQCSRDDFESHIFDQEVQVLLGTLDMSSRDAMRLFNMLDSEDSGVINLEDFVHACATLRGSANAVHMESVFIDSQIANAKLDEIMTTLEEHWPPAQSGQLAMRLEAPMSRPLESKPLTTPTISTMVTTPVSKPLTQPRQRNDSFLRLPRSSPRPRTASPMATPREYDC